MRKIGKSAASILAAGCAVQETGIDTAPQLTIVGCGALLFFLYNSVGVWYI